MTTSPDVTTRLVLALDLIERAELAVESITNLADDTGVTFTRGDVVRHVMDRLPDRYPHLPPGMGSHERAVMSIVDDVMSGRMYAPDEEGDP